MDKIKMLEMERLSNIKEHVDINISWNEAIKRKLKEFNRGMIGASEVTRLIKEIKDNTDMIEKLCKDYMEGV